MTTQTMNFKIDGELKAQFTLLAKELGLTPSAFLTMFVKKAVDVQGAPFEVKVTNQLNPVYRQLIAEENAKILGIIPDDATVMKDEEFDEILAGYGL